jgi:NDP-sugar pyrophosphorylase family protein
MFICLAAGRGERMKPLTRYLHKAMIPFHGLPLLAYSLLSIPSESVITLIVNHLAEQFIEYFGDHYRGRKIEYFKQTDLKGTGDALFQYSEAYQPERPVIVWHADQLMFPEEVNALAQHEANAAICCETKDGLKDVGLWKIKPSTLRLMRGLPQVGEQRALPVLERESLRKIIVQREKLEISFKSWDQIQESCELFKQKYPTEFR